MSVQAKARNLANENEAARQYELPRKTVSHVEARMRGMRKINTRRTQRMEMKLQRSFTFKALIVFIAIAVTFSVIVYNNVKINELVVNKTKYSQTLETLRSENRRLNVELEKKVNLKEIEEYAVNKLHMVKLETKKVQYITMVVDDKADILNKNDESNKASQLMSSATRFLDRLINYFN